MTHLKWLTVTGIFFVMSVARADCDPQGTIEKALGCISGATFKEITLKEDPKIPAGYRRFEIWITQPVDHFNPAYGTFRQKLALLHRDLKEPMILQTSGYLIFSVALTDLAKAFGANQLQVEHRYFDQSTPSILDWSRLNIAQSAYDFHRITTEFKKIFQARWVNTGASKGGMTSVYHRRFFPNDLDGTVADVAPLSFSKEDPRYITFVDNAGGKPYESCRQKLEALQIALLKRRAEMLPLITGSFLYLGGKSVSFEHAVIEMAFTFWQYHDPEDPKVGCKKIPAVDAPAADVMAFLQVINPVSGYGDTDVLQFMPYFFQAGTQLGGPASALRHLSPYRLHPYGLDQYMPHTAHYGYNNRAMIDVANWVRTRADHFLFIYGEFDPWSAGAFPLHKDAGDFHRFIVPAGNHGSKFHKLPAKEKAESLAIVGAWLKKAAVVTRATGDSLDDLELEIRRTKHLP